MATAESKLYFSRTTTIKEIQQEFSRSFRWLKIEFYSKPHSITDKKVVNNMYSSGLKLEEIGFRSDSVVIDINSDMTVKELEELIRKKTGLYAQVFRRSGKVWLETSATDNWTLAEQNEEGESLQKQLNNERENPDDHDMW
jgi:hypothetical protein